MVIVHQQDIIWQCLGKQLQFSSTKLAFYYHSTRFFYHSTRWIHNCSNFENRNIGGGRCNAHTFFNLKHLFFNTYLSGKSHATWKTTMPTELNNQALFLRVCLCTLISCSCLGATLTYSPCLILQTQCSVFCLAGNLLPTLLVAKKANLSEFMWCFDSSYHFFHFKLKGVVTAKVGLCWNA